MTTFYGVLTADMFGTESAPGEHVDWSEPDIFTAELFAEYLGDPAEFAEENPWMIVFEVTP